MIALNLFRFDSGFLLKDVYKNLTLARKTKTKSWIFADTAFTCRAVSFETGEI